MNVRHASPRKLELALDEGCTVVACHCGTGWWWDRPDMLPDFLRMLRRAQEPVGRPAVLGSAGRVRDLLRLLADHGIADRLLHGSDFPFPSLPLGVYPALGEAGDRVATGEQLDAAGFRIEERRWGSERQTTERAERLVCGKANP